MRRVTAYTAREILAPALSAVAVATFLLLSTQILRVGEAAFGYGVTALDFVILLLLLMPRFLVYTLPVAVLVGVVAGIGRLAEDREVTAFTAAGLSPVAFWPAPVMLGLLTSLGTLGLTVYGEPWALQTLGSRLTQIVERNLAADLRPGVLHEDLPGAVLFARDRRRDGTLEDVFVRLEVDGAEASVAARRARLEPLAGRGLRLRVEDGELVQPGLREPSPEPPDGEPALPELTRLRFDRATLDLDVGEVISRRVSFIGTYDVMSFEALLHLIETSSPRAWARHKARIALHRRLALPWASLSLAVFGLGLALTGARAPRGKGRSGFIVGVAGVLGYYVLGRLGENLALTGQAPVWLTPWVPNVVFLCLGAGLLWRLARR